MRSNRHDTFGERKPASADLAPTFCSCNHSRSQHRRATKHYHECQTYGCACERYNASKEPHTQAVNRIGVTIAARILLSPCHEHRDGNVRRMLGAECQRCQRDMAGWDVYDRFGVRSFGVACLAQAYEYAVEPLFYRACRLSAHPGCRDMVAEYHVVTIGHPVTFLA